MSRVGFFLSIIVAVVGLCLMAWRLSAATDAREAVADTSGGTTTAALASDGPIDQANRTVAIARIEQAVSLAESYATQNGSYAGVSTEVLHVLDPSLDVSVVVVSASNAGYCIQAASGLAVVHAAGPGEPPADGPCA